MQSSISDGSGRVFVLASQGRGTTRTPWKVSSSAMMLDLKIDPNKSIAVSHTRRAGFHFISVSLHCFRNKKGKYHANLLSFQNPKMFVCRQKQVCYKLSPSAIKLSMHLVHLARHRVSRYGLKLEKC